MFSRRRFFAPRRPPARRSRPCWPGFAGTSPDKRRTAPAEKSAESFATAGYPLWHANVQARKNFLDGIMPPLSGSPEFNLHADDIDFQMSARGQQLQAVVMVLIAHNVRFEGLQMAATLARLPAPRLDPA